MGAARQDRFLLPPPACNGRWGFDMNKQDDYRAALHAIGIMLTLWSALCWVLYH